VLCCAGTYLVVGVVGGLVLVAALVAVGGRAFMRGQELRRSSEFSRSFDVQSESTADTPGEHARGRSVLPEHSCVDVCMLLAHP
jgi:hypothetical protein